MLSFSLPFPAACHRFFAPPLRAGAFLSFIAQAPSSVSVFRLPWREILLPRQLRHPPFQGTACSPSKVLIPFSHTEKKLLAVSSLRLFSERPPAFDRVSSHVRSRLVPCAVVPRLAFAIKYRDRGAWMPFPAFHASHKSIAAPPPSPVAPSLISVEI